ncbi:MAG: carboxypeptidase-like regulatory domain-containing protein [Treponema sp.]|jgi:hypothetical protein|nr:carboxypeptidase-like regulatory domain-containing protein [Treponema sp.]
MKKILEKLRIILKTVYVALGAAVTPAVVHAGYGQMQPDLSSYTVPVQGRVVSDETGEPVAGIQIYYHPYVNAKTDSDGRFLIYVPEEDSYTLDFYDIDSFENNGFFTTKFIDISRDEIKDPLAVSLYRESQVTVIRGTVRSQGTGEPVSGVNVSVDYGVNNSSESGETRDTSFIKSRFEALSDNDGQFYIQVPERDTYRIYFGDANRLFQWKRMSLTSDEIKAPLRVDLEPITREEKEETGEHGE